MFTLLSTSGAASAACPAGMEHLFAEDKSVNEVASTQAQCQDDLEEATSAIYEEFGEACVEAAGDHIEDEVISGVSYAYHPPVWTCSYSFKLYCCRSEPFTPLPSPSPAPLQGPESN